LRRQWLVYRRPEDKDKEMRMKRGSPAAGVWLLMLVLVAMDTNDAAYIDSADADAIGDNDDLVHLTTIALMMTSPLAGERSFVVIMSVRVSVCEHISGITCPVFTKFMHSLWIGPSLAAL